MVFLKTGGRAGVKNDLLKTSVKNNVTEISEAMQ